MPLLPDWEGNKRPVVRQIAHEAGRQTRQSRQLNSPQL